MFNCRVLNPELNALYSCMNYQGFQTGSLAEDSRNSFKAAPFQPLLISIAAKTESCSLPTTLHNAP